jgi:hypothetical protein
MILNSLKIQEIDLKKFLSGYPGTKSFFRTKEFFQICYQTLIQKNKLKYEGRTWY